MEDKENIFKISCKRKSLSLDDEIDSKRSLNNFNVESVNIAINSKYKIDEEVKSDGGKCSDCIYSSLKDINISPSFIDSCNETFDFSCNNTPKEQVLPLSDFLKLPKPEVVKSHEQYEEVKLEKSLSANCISENTYNDSFDILKTKLSRCPTYTPSSFVLNNTPETPCGLHDIDIDNMESIHSLGRDSVTFNDIPYKLSKSIFQKNMAQISPIFYESETANESVIQQKKRCIPGCSNPTSLMCGDVVDNVIEEIDAKLVSKIIENDFTSNSFAYHIIDCRYPYEYGGGHIDGAVNLYTPYQLLNYIFLSKYDVEELAKPLGNPEGALISSMKEILSIERPPSHWKYNAFIFHCEFSSIRGPELARCLRNMDRLANWSNYPKLYFPNVYIMSKGYREFFSKYKKLCKPQHYVKMDVVDPNREKGECMIGDSDEEDSLNNSSNIIDNDEVQRRLKMYNVCKKETLEQMRLFSRLVNSQILMPQSID